MLTVHVLPLPEQAPLHWRNPEPLEAEAVRVTADPSTNSSTQHAPHSIPSGSLVTVPSPVPDFHTVSLWEGAPERLKVAVTSWSWLMVTWHVRLLPEQPPLHPVNTEAPEGEAVSVTTAPATKSAEHELPQAIPSGLLVTVPLPAPSFVADRV